MKFNKIVLFFIIALPVSVALSFFQLYYTVEAKTGFLKTGYEALGIGALAVIVAFALATAIFSFFSHRSPEAPPKTNLIMSISSLTVAATVFYDAFIAEPLTIVPALQSFLLRIGALAAAVFFLLFALAGFFGKKLPEKATIIPLIYFILKTIHSFLAISAIALIPDNIMMILVYCSVILFFLEFARVYNNATDERSFRKLMASGFASVILCFAQSVPHIFLDVSLTEAASRTSIFSSINILFIGFFITAFIFSHFSKRNSCL